MNKLFWSAFAVSLIILPAISRAQFEDIDDFEILNKEILPEAPGPKIFNPPDLHVNDNIDVSSEKVGSGDLEPVFGQTFSTIPWSNINTDEFLSVTKWITERELKDQHEDWRQRIRAATFQEHVGKILQCIGECFIYRGIERATVQHLSQVKEGDEMHTGKDSVAWIYFMDGSLMRLGAETSISFQEINFSKTEVFHLARLNRGHIYWHPRLKKELPFDDGPETDSMSLPLLVRDANTEASERMLFQKQADPERVSQLYSLNHDALMKQFESLNGLIKKNNEGIKLQTRMMLVSPNASVVSREGSFDFIFIPGGKSYTKKRTSRDKDEMELHLRGYTNNTAHKITEEAWIEIDPLGRNFSALEDAPGAVQIMELLTKRIKSIELARELWVSKLTIPLMAALDNPEALEKNFGYIVWNDDLEKRYNFLVEYTRRIETTNLRSLENLLIKLQEKGEPVQRELSPVHYQKSLNHYLFGLKKRYDKNKLRVKEFNDLQYYVWILRHGKF